MIHIISKFAPLPFYPIGLCLVLMLAAIVVLALNRRRAAIWLMSAGVAILYVFSLPVTAHLMLGPLERRHYPLHEYPQVSAVVLLGGAGVYGAAPRKFHETNGYGDRLFHAARVFRTGCAPFLITTGGVLPFVYASPTSEASIVSSQLRELLLVDSASILLGDRSRNTREDALEVVRLLGERELPYRVLLVTSAFHMDRSSKVFKKAGVDVIEAPTDYAMDHAFQWKLLRFLPSADALNQVCMALHEYYGLLAYRALGWI